MPARTATSARSPIQLGVRYVVEGSVRRAANRVVVTTQLIDTASRRNLWAERYDRVVEEIFAVQEEVTRSIVTAITPEIAAAELAKARRHRPADLSAYEIALRAWGDAWTVYRKADAAGLDGIFAQAEQALAIDPESTLALNCVAFRPGSRCSSGAPPRCSTRASAD